MKSEKKEPIESSKFDELYSLYAPMVYALAYRSTFDHAAAEDIKQNVFVTALVKIETLGNHPNPAGWLYKTTAYATRHYWRSIKQKYENEVPLTDVSDIADPAEIMPDTFADLLPDTLKPKEHQMLAWYYMDGLSLKEIAKRCGITYATCRVYMTLIKRKMKKFYEDN